MRDTFDSARAGPGPLGLRRLEGRLVLAALATFFGVVFAVNGYFLVRALSTHTGVVAVEPYRKGLAYNERIAAGERQAALGWQDEVMLDRDGTVSISLADHGGTPVTGLRVAGVISRPSTAAVDRALDFTEIGPGHYAAPTGGVSAGTWIVVIEARRAAGEEPAHRARRRLWQKP